MSQEKINPSDKLSGWDTTLVAGKGLKLRFLSPGTSPGQFESGPWVTLNAKQCQALAEELLQESKKI
ncbi:MAG: hypothetical protein EOP36_02950 [Rubrivivax sp.]|nr:MAG: hypothetical protein EOP36_02950 [Rubrivivax sp.]